ncbi:hypothetical protein SAMN05443270_4628 [Lacrimispora sphenoides]|jgi:hypothetical protein|uniref:hypothetical protein n=1 Tax=Lacrimispora sphenoides TaxID=29370 RepID=UPI0008C49BF7|nr:hypothetical protein [Lacrimispora sphenoides]SEU28848.1 hypothetical protein SAMN05443270_4628 [Lacrimispora sphenoides]
MKNGLLDRLITIQDYGNCDKATDSEDMADFLIEVIDELHLCPEIDKTVERLKIIMDDDNIRFIDQAVRRAINIVNDEYEDIL